MKTERYFIAFDRYEMGMMLEALVRLKNQLLAEGRYTDYVDELIIKVGEAPTKKFKVLEPVDNRYA